MSTTPSSTENELNLVSIFDPVTCTRKGLCPVTQIRNSGDPFESHSLYFEQHGTGPIKVVFIMGLNSSSFAWTAEVKYFAQKPEYSLLVFDNRGVGHSGVPKGPYTTSGMAEDVIALLDYIGWTEKRGIHVVGASLGGMIAQELAYRIHDRIISLSLLVTTPGGRLWTNLPPRKGATSLAKLMTTKEPAMKIPIILGMLFPQAWLNERDEDDPSGRTNREVQAEAYRKRIELTPPQQFLGAVSQMSAALTHHVQSDRLHKISQSIPKVLILTGDQDNLVDPSGSRTIASCMPEAEFVEFKGAGHAVNVQNRSRFHALLEKTFQEGIAKVQASSSA